jgi:Spy/CpxP family protein refolding chaperone
MRSTRHLLAAAVAMTAVTAGMLAAQPPAVTPAPGAPAGQGQHGDHARTRGPGGRGGMRAQLLRDITLSDAQRTQIRAIADRYRAQQRQLADDARAKWRGDRPAARRDAGARPDSATRAAFRAEREAFRTRVRDLRQRQLAEMRAVLTPAQQASFDRNVAALRERGADRAGRFGPRGPRGERGPGRAGAR